MRSTSKDDSKRWDNERLREILFKLAYKQLTPGEWKRLAHFWAFTEEQIRAIEHQYTGKFTIILHSLLDELVRCSIMYFFSHFKPLRIKI